MSGTEVNFDGLVGPTHHYAGLSFGNEASTRYRNTVANPRLAAKQGLMKISQLWNQYFKKASNDIFQGYSGKGYNYTAASYLVVSLGEDQVYSNQGDLLPSSAARNLGDLLP